MIRLLALALFAATVIGCANDSHDSGTSKPTKVKIADEDYKTLLAADNDTLVRHAKAGELGVCTLVDGGWGQYYTPQQELWTVYLRDKGLYYPDMTTTAKPEALLDAGWELKKALEEGFCFLNMSSPTTPSHQ